MIRQVRQEGCTDRLHLQQGVGCLLVCCCVVVGLSELLVSDAMHQRAHVALEAFGRCELWLLLGYGFALLTPQNRRVNDKVRGSAASPSSEP